MTTVERAARPQGDERVRQLHRRGLDALNGGRPAVSVGLLRKALGVLGWPAGASTEAAGWRARPELATLVMGTLAAAEVARGNTARGFAVLDAADAIAAERDGVLADQRALLLVMVGRIDEALRCLNAIIPALRRSDEGVRLARALLNRALLHQTTGRIRPAMVDLAESGALAGALGLPVQGAKAFHGLGACELIAGNIPAALRAFDAAQRGYAAHGDGMLAVLAADKARALLAAGLCTAAITELDDALARFADLRMTQEHAEAELTRAQVALAVHDLTSAGSLARRAQRRFHRRGNDTWAAVAALTLVRVRLEGGTNAARAARHAARLGDRLQALGLADDAQRAFLLAARARIAGGRPELARPYLRLSSAGRLETRLLRSLVRAELRAAEGDRAGALAHARGGLAVLDTHRQRFGSLDLQTGTTSLGDQLVHIGLAAAVELGRPAMIFRWLERSRAQAFRFRPARQPADPETADALAEMRQLGQRIRVAELAGEPQPAAARRLAELQRRVQTKSWQSEGAGRHLDVAPFADVRARLAGDGGVLVSFFAHEGRLRALLVGAGRSGLHDVGDQRVVAESAARLRGDLDALCGRRLPRQMDGVVRASVAHQLGVLDAELLAPLRRLIGDADLVLVPTGVLSSVPWGLLPGLRGRPVTVAPSASTWLAAAGAAAGGRSRVARAPLLVAGPDLDNAPAEIARLGRLYGDATTLVGAAATVGATLRALPACDSLHIAAHGHHEHQNPLFSRLDLADGPLLAHEVHQLGAAPPHVVLSSCDVGRTVVRTGDELLGFTAALLYSGTHTVISSVARVDDVAAADVMVAYHSSLRAGTPPARALAAATAAAPLMPLVCFGCG